MIVMNVSMAGGLIRRRSTVLLASGMSCCLALGAGRAAAEGSAAKPKPAALNPAPEGEEDPPEVRLGERIFLDTRFSSRDADKPFSCRTCHLVDELTRKEGVGEGAAAGPMPDYLASRTDPDFFAPGSSRDGMRAYVDYARRSLIPRRKEDSGNTVELRNSPTMLDSDQMKALHHDGEFPSLEALTIATLTGRNMGWLPGEEEKALDNAYNTLMTDKGEGEGAEGTYIQQFRATYQYDLLRSDRAEAINMLARAVSDYMRSLHTERDAPYDQFIKANGLPEGPDPGEDPEKFGKRLMDIVFKLDGQNKLKEVEGFGRAEITGMYHFFRGPVQAMNQVRERITAGTNQPDPKHVAAGSCVACHVPPFFTDFSFHNTGVSQMEYDAVHGEGEFAKLKIPAGADVKRPDPRFRAIPDKASPGEVDLGHWNFASLTDSLLRKEGESADAFLSRMVGTMKTPTLRDLKFTEPYFHNGSATTLREAVAEYIRVGGPEPPVNIINRDPKLKHVQIDADAVDPLVSFLNALNDNYE